MEKHLKSHQEEHLKSHLEKHFKSHLEEHFKSHLEEHFKSHLGEHFINLDPLQHRHRFNFHKNQKRRVSCWYFFQETLYAHRYFQETLWTSGYFQETLYAHYFQHQKIISKLTVIVIQLKRNG